MLVDRSVGSLAAPSTASTRAWWAAVPPRTAGALRHDLLQSPCSYTRAAVPPRAQHDPRLAAAAGKDSASFTKRNTSAPARALRGRSSGRRLRRPALVRSAAPSSASRVPRRALALTRRYGAEGVFRGGALPQRRVSHRTHHAKFYHCDDTGRDLRRRRTGLA